MILFELFEEDGNEDKPKNIYNIPSDNLAQFQHLIAKLSKRSIKLIGLPIKPVILGSTMKPGRTKGEFIKVYQVFLDAPIPKLDGWTFVARVDHSNETGNIIRSVPNTGIEIPEKYRTAPPLCDHCRKIRTRRDTFILVNDESGEFKQVGSNCLKDFFGHDPARIARMAELLSYADECGNAAETSEGGGGMKDRRWISLFGFLENSAAMIRLHGWVSAKAAYEDESKTSTKQMAMTNMFPYSDYDRTRRVEPSTADTQVAEEALVWARSLADKQQLSDYEHNVLVIADAEVIEYRSSGIAASIVAVYLMNKAREEQRKAQQAVVSKAENPFVGAVGERLRDLKATVVGKNTFEGHFGMTTLYSFLSDQGNVLKWFATGSGNLEQGDKVIITGTVKKHENYRGTEQTILSRCKVVKI